MKRWLLILLGCMVLGCSTRTRPGDAAAAREADLIFTNGRIYTVDAARTWADAVAIRAGRFVAVGSVADVLEFEGPGTEFVDLGRKLVLPGLIDNHAHGVAGAIVTSGLDIADGRTKQEQIQLLRDHAASHPDDTDTVIGYGWQEIFWPGPEGPHRSLLDEIFGGRPVFLVRSDGHALWMNSAAIDQAGLTPETPDPIPGVSYFGRDDDGSLSGFAEENAAWILAFRSAIVLDQALVESVFPAFAQRAAREGLTGFLDPGVLLLDESEAYRAVAAIDSKEPLPFRMRGSHYSLPVRGVDHVAIIKAMRDELPSGRVRADVLKINVDGSPENHTAAFLQPYRDRPETRGSTQFSEQELFAMVAGAYEAGIDVHFHIAGDRAVRLALDAIEAARERFGPKDVRMQLTHAYFVHPDDVARFSELDAGWSTAGEWIMPHETYESWRVQLGDERMSRIFPTRTLFEAGVEMGWAGDYPVAATFPTTNLLDQIEMGVTRRRIGDTQSSPLEPLGEALTLEQSVYLATLGGARLMGTGDIAGSIEVGKSADFVVLENDIFAGPAHEIHGGTVIRTVFEGRTVHEQ